jgi:O-antigen/teichoic acid export membrane protein
MKNLILLLISVSVFLLGIIFRLIPLPGSGILLVTGLALFVVFSAIKYFEKKSPVMRKVLIISSIVLLASLLLAMIRNEHFAELLLGGVILGLIAFLVSLMYGSRKKKSAKEE